jgi:hypothetical protein
MEGRLGAVEIALAEVRLADPRLVFKLRSSASSGDGVPNTLSTAGPPPGMRSALAGLAVRAASPVRPWRARSDAAPLAGERSSSQLAATAPPVPAGVGRAGQQRYWRARSLNHAFARAAVLRRSCRRRSTARHRLDQVELGVDPASVGGRSGRASPNICSLGEVAAFHRGPARPVSGRLLTDRRHLVAGISTSSPPRLARTPAAGTR